MFCHYILSMFHVPMDFPFFIFHCSMDSDSDDADSYSSDTLAPVQNFPIRIPDTFFFRWRYGLPRHRFFRYGFSDTELPDTDLADTDLFGTDFDLCRIVRYVFWIRVSRHGAIRYVFRKKNSPTRMFDVFLIRISRHGVFCNGFPRYVLLPIRMFRYDVSDIAFPICGESRNVW